MIAKDSLLKLAKREFATTLKVLKAYPPEMKDYKPHERSSNAIGLISTFIFELYLIRMHLLGDPIDPSVFKTYKPDGIPGVISDFEKESGQVIAGLERMPEAEFSKNVTFAGRTFEAGEFALMMICDQIHHRGQLSVYIRSAGGKVPSIYGPSADDPVPNL
jgi:uncharacterized damage-inducible protein DinB